jgi:7-cyano-7-deazaguanine synthase
MGGGIDSTTLVPYLRRGGFAVWGVHFDYGQPASTMERRALSSISNHFHIDVSLQEVRPSIRLDADGFRCRNAILLMSAAQSCEGPCVLAIGIHSGTPFYDCGATFLGKVKALIADYSGGTIRVVAPWLDLTKADVVVIARELGVPLQLTYSCQVGQEQPCGRCLSCRDREATIGPQ